MSEGGVDNPFNKLVETRIRSRQSAESVEQASPEIGGTGAEIHVHTMDWTRLEAVLGGAAVVAVIASVAGLPPIQAAGLSVGLVLLSDAAYHRFRDARTDVDRNDVR